MELDTIVCMDVLAYLRTLPDGCIDCVVTSPPYYGLRDYGVDGQIGLEQTPMAYIGRLVAVFTEVKRVLKSTGTLWLNIGDSFAGSNNGSGDSRTVNNLGTPLCGRYNKHKPISDLPHKNLMLIPHRLAIALQDGGWIVRADIVWSKPNPMPESVKDRPTKAHEYVFLLAKSARYDYDADAIAEPALEDNRIRSFRKHGLELERNDTGGLYVPKNLKPDGQTPHSIHLKRANGGGEYTSVTRNCRSVWDIPVQPNALEHFAIMPEGLVERCIKAGCPKNGVVLDPFMGSGTTAKVARRLDRHYIGCDLNADYVKLANQRLRDTDPYQSTELADGSRQLSLFE